MEAGSEYFQVFYDNLEALSVSVASTNFLSIYVFSCMLVEGLLKSDPGA